MTHQLIQLVEKKYLRSDLPEIKPGNYIRVWQKIKEEKREFSQAFEGLVISIKGGGTRKTMIVRGQVAGQMVEKIYHLNSPVIEKIDILGKAKTRKAKLYFVRKLHPREIKRKLKIKIA